MADINEIVSWTPEQLTALRYEQAREALDAVVVALEDAEVPLEELMRLWEVGEQLANACEAHLTRARERLEAANPAEA